MPGIKRPRAEEETHAGAEGDNVHPSRKRRLETGEVNAELGSILNELRDEIEQVRLKAAGKLLKTLFTKSEDQAQRLDYVVTRLIKGLCSGAKAARLGFSIALIEVLRSGFATDLKVSNVVDKVLALTNPEGKQSGEEKRNYLIGRQWAFQAILRSNVLEKAPAEDARYLFDAISELASQKDWLRNECGVILNDFLKSQEATQVPDENIRAFIDSWFQKGLIKSPEGVALWLTIKKSFSGVKLPKGVWHHHNPLSSQERPTLSQILLKNAIQSDEEPDVVAKKKKSGSRQVRPSFAWQVILSYLYEEDKADKFTSFWDDCVAKPMFSSSSSTERKSLGLQIFTQAIAAAPPTLLGDVIHTNIIHGVVDQRSKSDRYLFEAAKLPLHQMASRAKQEPAAASAMVSKLLAVIPPNVDKMTKATIDAMLAAADSNGLGDIVTAVVDLCRIVGTKDTVEAEKKRRMLADVLLSVVRSRRSEPAQFFTEDGGLRDWLQTLLRSLTHFGYTTPSEKISPLLSAASREVFRERLMSCLGLLVDLPLKQAIRAPTLVVDTLNDSKGTLDVSLDQNALATLKESRKLIKDAAKKAKTSDDSTATVMRAFQLLLALGMLQVYKQEPDSIGVLEDITACYQSPKETGDASAMLVELLLSFVSKQSALFRKLAEQVFAAFAPDVTAEGLQSMIDILSQKESLAGQQELFNDNEDGEDDAASDDEEVDLDDMDVEDASDVEIVNGNVAGEDDSDSDSNDDEPSADDDSEDEETAAFSRKLADALGTTGMENDSDSDGSDMSDSQMEALDGHLTTIFSERKKASNKKQDNKDAKENIVNFKNRVLDLLTVYVKSQPTNILALDLIHPLVTLVRTTASPPTAKKAFEVLEAHFDACKKQKALPTLSSTKPVFALLSAVHEEIKLGGSKVHASACSRSSQFLAKVLVAKNAKHWRKVAEMYVELQDEWRRDPKSRIQGSVFNDWHNWSMQRA